jgi:hypothetical protein
MQASINRDHEGDLQNRHQSQQDASIAAAVPASVVTRAPLARMLGLRQYIAHAAIALRGPNNRPAHRYTIHPARQDMKIIPNRATNKREAKRERFAATNASAYRQ